MATTLLYVGTEPGFAAAERVLRADFGRLERAMDEPTAVQAVRRLAADVVVHDAPGSDTRAAAFCREVRTAAGRAHLPIMLLVDALAEDPAAALREGPTDALARPWAPSQLRARLRMALLRARVPAQQRLAAVERTGLTASPPSATLDRLVRVLARVIDAPTALVTLVEAERQFFAAQVGLGEPWATARQTPLSHSFCQHVAATDVPLVVADAREHPLLRENRAIDELGVVAYAGVPLAAPDGQTLGSVCVIDQNPREWTAEELALLGDVAAVAAALVESAGLAERAGRLANDARLPTDARAEAGILAQGLAYVAGIPA